MSGRIEGESSRGELTSVSKILQEKGLFGPYTPKGEDPTWYPLEVMHELQDDLDIKIHQAGGDTDRAEKFAAWKKSLKKIEMTYHIIASPHSDNPGYAVINILLVDDAKEHPNIDVQEYPHRGPIDLNDEERSIIGRLTLARGLPFDPGKRVYNFLELSILSEAQHVVMEEEARRLRQEVDEEGTDEPPPAHS
jgi:hypothetical protein